MSGRKVLTVMFKYDYGKKNRGFSGEKEVIVPALEKVFEIVDTFWLEENGYPDKKAELQDNIVAYAKSSKPDLILFMMLKNEIGKETLVKLKDIAITANWFCDDQWRFDSFSRYVSKYLTYSITTDKYSLPLYHRNGIQNVILSQWACAKNPENIQFDDMKYEYDVSFVGMRNATRAWIINDLKKNGIDVQCFGTGWTNGRVTYSEMAEIVRTSKINLNLSNNVPTSIKFYKFFLGYGIAKALGFGRSAGEKYIAALVGLLKDIKFVAFSKKTEEGLKARCFELAGFGGFQISPFALEVEDYFIPGREIILYSTANELAKLIRYYLSHEPERLEIAEKSHARSFDNTYYQRFSDVKKKIFG